MDSTTDTPAASQLASLLIPQSLALLVSIICLLHILKPFYFRSKSPLPAANTGPLRSALRPILINQGFNWISQIVSFYQSFVYNDPVDLRSTSRWGVMTELLLILQILLLDLLIIEKFASLFASSLSLTKENFMRARLALLLFYFLFAFPQVVEVFLYYVNVQVVFSPLYYNISFILSMVYGAVMTIIDFTLNGSLAQRVFRFSIHKKSSNASKRRAYFLFILIVLAFILDVTAFTLFVWGTTLSTYPATLVSHYTTGMVGCHSSLQALIFSGFREVVVDAIQFQKSHEGEGSGEGSDMMKTGGGGGGGGGQVYHQQQQGRGRVQMLLDDQSGGLRGTPVNVGGSSREAEVPTEIESRTGAVSTRIAG